MSDLLEFAYPSGTDADFCIPGSDDWYQEQGCISLDEVDSDFGWGEFEQLCSIDWSAYS